jgi:hypothetical protein
VVIGTLAGFDADGAPLVGFPENPAGGPVAALATAGLDADAVGREVALLFAEGDPGRPLIIGVVRRPLDAVLQASEAREAAEPEPDEPESEPVARVDGERVVLSAEREIVLKCGKASITLTRAGKILIRGAHLLSRSSGANRIKGASIQLN